MRDQDFQHLLYDKLFPLLAHWRLRAGVDLDTKIQGFGKRMLFYSPRTFGREKAMIQSWYTDQIIEMNNLVREIHTTKQQLDNYKTHFSKYPYILSKVKEIDKCMFKTKCNVDRASESLKIQMHKYGLSRNVFL